MGLICDVAHTVGYLTDHYRPPMTAGHDEGSPVVATEGATVSIIKIGIESEVYPEGADWSTVDFDWSTVDDSPLACVRRGMLYLLSTYPERLSTVDVGVLDVQDSVDCPLAQVSGTGDFLACREYGTMRGAWFVAHGFMPKSPRRGFPDSPVRTCELSRLWRKAFREVQSTMDGA